MGAVVAVEMVHGEGTVRAGVHAPGMADAPVTAVAAVQVVQSLPEHNRGDVADPARVVNGGGKVGRAGG